MVAKINFGKYKAEEYTVEELFLKDPKYCQWLRNQPFVKNNEELYDELNEVLKDVNDDDYILNFGKHKGKSLKQIYNLDQSYITWLRKNDYVKQNCKRLCEELEELDTITT